MSLQPEGLLLCKLKSATKKKIVKFEKRLEQAGEIFQEISAGFQHLVDNNVANWIFEG